MYLQYRTVQYLCVHSKGLEHVRCIVYLYRFDQIQYLRLFFFINVTVGKFVHQEHAL
jgi:hypothetical protein